LAFFVTLVVFLQTHICSWQELQMWVMASVATFVVVSVAIGVMAPVATVQYFLLQLGSCLQ